MNTEAGSIKQSLQNVVSSCNQQITNAVAKGMDSGIMSIKHRVGGFRNRQNFKTDIFSAAVDSAFTQNDRELTNSDTKKRGRWQLTFLP